MVQEVAVPASSSVEMLDPALCAPPSSRLPRPPFQRHEAHVRFGDHRRGSVEMLDVVKQQVTECPHDSSRHMLLRASWQACGRARIAGWRSLWDDLAWHSGSPRRTSCRKALACRQHGWRCRLALLELLAATGLHCGLNSIWCSRPHD